MTTAKIFHRIAQAAPNLKTKLLQAGMADAPEEFIKKTIVSAFYMTTGIMLIIAAMLSKAAILRMVMLVLSPLVFVVVFFYLLKLPDVRILKREREINKDLVFAGRFLVIELEAGVSIYDALINVTKNFEELGKYFEEIVTQVDMGTPLEDAIARAIEITPSNNFRKMMWQVLNSLKTGADVSDSLKAVIEQIVREQTIEIKDYGRKLNPFAMFYMMLAIIVPTLGTTMLIIFSSFLSLEIGLTELIIMACAFGFMQVMFIVAMKNQRPSFEM